MKSNLLNTERPSSFPGIWKYPAGRELHFQSVIDWMNGKRQDDDLNGLWRVHNKIYDLQTFIKHHPGGSDWLEMTRGTDITESFEVSHIANPKMVEKTLKSYFVCDATSPRVSPYTFNDNGFYKILKAKVGPVIKVIGTGPSYQILLMMDFLAIVFLIMTLLATISNSTILQILAGVVLTATIIAAHNFLHLRENWRRYYLDFGWLSSYEYRISHVFSHHLFPNTIMDFEMSTFEPILEFMPKRNKNWIQRYGPVLYNHIVYPYFFFVTFVTRWIRIFKGHQEFYPENVLVILHLLLCLGFSPALTSGIASWFIIHFTSAYFFLLVGINAAHHHPAIFHDGDEARQDPDFGLCQLDAVRDRSDSLFQNSLFVQLIGFGQHSLHHLFPTICHSKLMYLKPILDETLQEFEEEFPALSQHELFIGALAQLRRIERHGIETQKEKSLNCSK